MSVADEICEGEAAARAALAEAVRIGDHGLVAAALDAAAGPPDWRMAGLVDVIARAALRGAQNDAAGAGDSDEDDAEAAFLAGEATAARIIEGVRRTGDHAPLVLALRHLHALSPSEAGGFLEVVARRAAGLP